MNTWYLYQQGVHESRYALKERRDVVYIPGFLIQPLRPWDIEIHIQI